ncbi:MAG TPA: hypothetical protein VF635_17565, partial [Propionibacteriaceae bacterium]
MSTNPKASTAISDTKTSDETVAGLTTNTITATRNTAVLIKHTRQYNGNEEKDCTAPPSPTNHGSVHPRPQQQTKMGDGTDTAPAPPPPDLETRRPTVHLPP